MITRSDLLRRIRLAGGMVKSYRAEEGIVFELLSGDRVPSNLANDLIFMHRVVPQQDGLPGLGDSQVYKVRDV